MRVTSIWCDAPMVMQDRIDPLIVERAPWMADRSPLGDWAKWALDGMLRYRQTLAIAETLKDESAHTVMARMARLIARRVEVEGLAHIPRSGGALIVANHPTGIADGLVLYRLLQRRRPDAFFFANADILRVLPQLDRVIAPVEWRHDHRTHAKTRATMTYTRRALDEGRIGVIFPSGRLAKRHWLSLVERPWMASAAMLARKFDVPVIPVHISARNSAMFYAFDLLHHSLRDITLFHETLNKRRQRFEVRIGQPIAPDDLSPQSNVAIAQLRDACLSLGERQSLGQPLLRTSFGGTRVRAPLGWNTTGP